MVSGTYYENFSGFFIPVSKMAKKLGETPHFGQKKKNENKYFFSKVILRVDT